MNTANDEQQQQQQLQQQQQQQQLQQQQEGEEAGGEGRAEGERQTEGEKQQRQQQQQQGIVVAAPGGYIVPASSQTFGYAPLFVDSTSASAPPPPPRVLIDEAGIKAIMNYGNLSQEDDQCPCFCGGCARGGCFRQAPTLLQLDTQTGTIGRINLLFRARHCFSADAATHPTGLMQNPPPHLFADGRLSPLEFHAWMQKLPAIGAMRVGVCEDVCVSLLALLSLMPCVCCWAAKRDRMEIEAWSAALLEWQTEFNRSVLVPRGMFIKTQSRCDSVYTKDGKQRHIERWLSIALTPAAVAALRAEPHLIGDVEPGCYSCGCDEVCTDERKLCMHP